MTGKKSTDKAADQAENKAPTQAERIEQAKQEAAATDHGDNPIVDVHGLPLPGDPQLLPGEVQTVGGVVTDDGGRPVTEDPATPATTDKPKG